MILRQTTEKAGYGYWDGGAKDTFDWSITGQAQEDKKGKYVKIGSHLPDSKTRSILQTLGGKYD